MQKMLLNIVYMGYIEEYDTIIYVCMEDTKKKNQEKMMSHGISCLWMSLEGFRKFRINCESVKLSGT